ncbi:DUF1127 domain-containing protein [Jannaschia sp. M317]|nr:DUF1127 domain-containing protein [Jannaschia sp. M317]UWQ17567.1 DUF1127 domain-containing protein [Jannaschia sp. M317]
MAHHIQTAFAQLSTRAQRRAARRELRALDDRSLEDIGLNRADIETRFG